jgi:hypothetical protein
MLRSRAGMDCRRFQSSSLLPASRVDFCSQSIRTAIVKAVPQDLDELNGIKELPGFPRAAMATLSKAWSAGLNLTQISTAEEGAARPRLEAIRHIEAEALQRLPSSMRRPADLVAAALSRLDFAKVVFGRISIYGRTEMSPVWRPLLAALSKVVEVRWVAGPRQIPSWVHGLSIPIIEAPPEKPEIQCESCAALEALRWDDAPGARKPGSGSSTAAPFAGNNRLFGGNRQRANDICWRHR